MVQNHILVFMVLNRMNLIFMAYCWFMGLNHKNTYFEESVDRQNEETSNAQSNGNLQS